MTEACWCGEIHEPHCPTCDQCGAPVSTGLMAALCPNVELCAFWPPDEASQAFVRQLRKLNGFKDSTDSASLQRSDT